MASSEEYLASLGFDTSDVDKAVGQTVTLLGHLGNQFDQVSKKSEKAERALLGTSAASKANAQSISTGTKATKEQASALEVASKQTALYNQYLFDQEKGMAKLNNASPALRYALYDIGRTATVAAVGIAAVGTAAAVASASYESAFTNVERTIEPGTYAVGALRQELIDLSNQIPLTFQELSGIATLGNQLGVNAAGISEFTSTVARFSAVAGVGYEETAKAFGSMTEVLGVAEQDYERLGSSIALVGRRSVATEKEILSLTREIGSQASRAGFTADEVVGLAGALGELRLPPERSRGALTTYFQTLNMAVAEGGDKLRDFATIIGVTSEELSTMVQSGQGVEVFQRFLTALGSGNTVQATQALDRLGLSQLRVSDVFTRLGDNVDIFNQNLASGAQGWNEGSELARQYAMVLDDLQTKWQLFLNALMTFGAAVGSQVAPALKSLLDISANILIALTGFIESPLGEWATRTVASLAALVAVYAALRGGIALATASILALRYATALLGGTGIVASLGAMATALGIVQGRAAGATGATLSFRGALVALGRATVVFAILQGAAELIFNFGGAMEALRQPIHLAIDLFFAFRDIVIGAAQSITYFLGQIPGGGVFSDWSRGLSDFQGTLKTSTKGVHDMFDAWVNSVAPATETTDEYTDAAYNASGASAGWADSLGNDGVGGAAGGAAKQVRTLIDYANDLSEVMSRAFEIRFSGGQASDAIASGWNGIRNAIAEVNSQISEYQATMMQLSSDKAIREYWLRVAENYGDALRAGELRAEIADIDNKLTKTAGDLSKAQDKNSKTLVGNSEAAIENRAEILGLVTNYQAYIRALAASGVPADQLAARAAQLRAEFTQQATQLGYNSTELAVYASAFDDVSLAIARVPRNITVTADVNPAIQALNELEAKAASVSSSLGGIGGGIGSGVKDVEAALQKRARLYKTMSMLGEAMLRATQAAAGGDSIGTFYWNSTAQFLNGLIASGSYRSGTAWTGSGNPWEIAGVVHNREAVLNARGTQTVGPAFVNAANQGRNPWAHAPAASAAPSFPSVMMVELSPIDRELVAAGKDVTVVVSGETIGQSAGYYDGDDSRRGGA